jgi:hypothetical protein
LGRGLGEEECPDRRVQREGDAASGRIEPLLSQVDQRREEPRFGGPVMSGEMAAEDVSRKRVGDLLGTGTTDRLELLALDLADEASCFSPGGDQLTVDTERFGFSGVEGDALLARLHPVGLNLRKGDSQI